MPALHQLTRCYRWLQVVPVVSDDPLFDGLRGSVADVGPNYADWSGRDAFVAGPPEMTQNAVFWFLWAGMDPSRVHHDELEAQGDG
jgi:NAD(P)H-flavin reductase